MQCCVCSTMCSFMRILCTVLEHHGGGHSLKHRNYDTRTTIGFVICCGWWHRCQTPKLPNNLGLVNLNNIVHATDEDVLVLDAEDPPCRDRSAPQTRADSRIGPKTAITTTNYLVATLPLCSQTMIDYPLLHS